MQASQRLGPVRDYLFSAFLYILPQHLLSRLMLRLTRSRFRPLKNAAIAWFIRRFAVDLSTAECSDPEGFSHFNSFFTRTLRKDARTLASEPDAIVCPVDGIVSQAGIIQEETLFQAKGRKFALARLLGGSWERAERFRNGSFATLYLSPQDYHRVHMPAAGTLREMIHVPGRLFSVSPATTRVIPELFARNERVVALFDTEFGPLAMILVGAIFVGSIETVWAGVVTPPRGTRVRTWTYGDAAAPIHLQRGEEMGRFNMGSTVILLWGANAVRWENHLQPDAKVQMGQRIGVALGLRASGPIVGKSDHLGE